ncbi:hypothetical protein [Dactylosporangium sp. NPDC049140]|uniref:hypothetical protein n=1 Tax=Dactylosporangium sp. NPDC049140 TaxID=3155647 RepID=UPI0033CCEA98
MADAEILPHLREMVGVDAGGRAGQLQFGTDLVEQPGALVVAVQKLKGQHLVGEIGLGGQGTQLAEVPERDIIAAVVAGDLTESASCGDPGAVVPGLVGRRERLPARRPGSLRFLGGLSQRPLRR